MKIRYFLIMAIMVGASVVHARQMSVQIREGQLRERPSFLGAVTASVDYGDRVSVQREQGPWRFVTMADREGWIHESALTRQRIKLEAGKVDVAGAATRDEMVLAGKGFSAEVEREYRAQNTDVDFSWVDRMEQMSVSMERIAQFLREGGVTPEGGR